MLYSVTKNNYNSKSAYVLKKSLSIFPVQSKHTFIAVTKIMCEIQGCAVPLVFFSSPSNLIRILNHICN